MEKETNMTIEGTETGMDEYMKVADYTLPTNRAVVKQAYETEKALFADKLTDGESIETVASIEALRVTANSALSVAQTADGKAEAAQTMAKEVRVELAGKVDKDDGKGLSTEDYTTAEKAKLAGIETNANNYVHPATHPANVIEGAVRDSQKLNGKDITYFAEKLRFDELHGTVNAMIGLVNGATDRADELEAGLGVVKKTADEAVKTVNGTKPDINGNVVIAEVANAQQFGSRPPSYYAKKTDADVAQTVADAAQQTAAIARTEAQAAQAAAGNAQVTANAAVPKSAVSTSVNDTSTTNVASASSVKAVYDKAVEAVAKSDILVTTGDAVDKVMSQKAVTDALNAVAEPAGCMKFFAGNVLPEGYLWCDGESYPVDGDYAKLYGAIGTSYNKLGDAAGTFRVPDMRGRVGIGKDAGTFDALGKAGGEETHQLAITEMPIHTVEQEAHRHGIMNNIYWKTILFQITGTGNSAIMGQGGSTQNAMDYLAKNKPIGGDRPHNNLQPYLVCNYIIKY